MISRIEFYASLIILAGIMVFSIYSNNTSIADIQRARTEVKDSVLQVQRDSAIKRSMKFELHADSLQAILNRKKLDLQIIKKKYETDKKNVLVLDADSTLSLFMRSVTPH